MGAAAARGGRAFPWPVGRSAAAGLGLVAVVAWLVLPSAPGYDTATHLVWARELLAGRAPYVNAAAAPTMHPLWLLVSLPVVVTGAGASLLQLLDLLALAVVVACVWRLAADLAGAAAGAIAALALGSSFALLLLAFKAYVDLPFLALALLAVVAERDWRPAAGVGGGAGGGPVGERDETAAGTTASARSAGGELAVPALLFVAGLLRPEAWGLGFLFLALRWARGAALEALVRPAAVVLAAPVLWALTDLVLAGDPLHSLTGTQELATALGRKTGLGNAPVELVRQLGDLARPPVAAAGLLGVVVAVRRLGWRPLIVPLAPLVAGVFGFLLVGALGLPLLQRYLLVPAALLGVFAGVAGAAILATALGRPLPGALRGSQRVVAGDQSEANPEPAGIERAAAGTGTRFVGTASDAAGTGTRFVGTASDAAAGTGTPGDAASRPAPLARALAVVLLLVGVAGAGGYLVLKADSFRVLADGVLREAEWQTDGTALLGQPELVAARRCGPVTLPTYRFVPEMQLATGLRPEQIVSRASELGGAGPQSGGVALTIVGSKAARTRLGEAAAVPHATNTVPPGFTVVARRGPFVAAIRCR